MLKEVIKLVRPGVFIPAFEAFHLSDKLILKPEYLSICAADVRYYAGSRPQAVLRKKLPLSLIHEAVGRVVYDPLGKLSIGTYCVLLPGGDDVQDELSNYREHAFFRSSSADGFCQEMMDLTHNEVLQIPDGENPEFYVFTELISVCCHALRRAKEAARILFGNKAKLNIGVWGDGILGYLMNLVISKDPLCASLSAVGKHEDRISLISSAQHKYITYDSCENLRVDMAFECVGGDGSAAAINDAIEHLSPCGTLVLMGVSEHCQGINTRRVLEKGITIIGCSRSRKEDFESAMYLIRQLPHKAELKKVIGKIIQVTSAEDLTYAFERHMKTKEKDILHICI